MAVAPNTPPGGDMTPPMKLGTSTFEPYTPDTSFDLQHKRHSSKQSEGPTSSPSSRINQVDLFRVLVTPSVSPPGEQPQSMPWRQRTAQDSFDLAQNHMRAKTFHEAETEFLNAVQMFTSSKGSDAHYELLCWDLRGSDATKRGTTPEKELLRFLYLRP